MEDIPNPYFVLLGRPCLKQIKVHYNWGNNILTIFADTKTMTLSIEKKGNDTPFPKTL
jgi:hypothetical protein